MALKKPSDLFDNKSEDNNIPIIESDNSFCDELNKVQNLSEQVIQLQQELSQKVIKNDLESLVLSQINSMQENFEYLQNDFKKSNKKDIVEFKERVSELVKIVGNLVENELPKYKKQVTKNEVRIGDKFDELKEVVEDNIVDIRSEIDSRVNDIAEVVDSNLEFFNNQLQETSSEVKKTTDTYNKLSKILENKVSKENERNDLYINEKFDELKEDVEENIGGIKEVVDSNLEFFNNQLQETSSEVKKTTDTYNKLSKILENKVSKENNKLEEYSQVIKSLHEAFVELEKSLQEKTSTHQQVIEEVIGEKFETISLNVNNRIDSIDKDVKNKINSIDEEVDTIKNKVSSDILSIKADVVIFEKHNKDTEKTIQEFSQQLYKISEIDKDIININEDIGKLQNQYDDVSNQSIETKKDLEIVERYIQNHHKKLVELKEEVFGEIEQIPVGNIQENLERLEKKIDYIKETYSKIKPEVIVKEVIKEGFLNEPSNTNNSDPLTPLDQKFVTLDQLQEHYRLFINRIQQQLSTIGGGGETRLEFLDDVDRDSAKVDGYMLAYQASTGKFIGTSVSGGGSASQWVSTTVGIHTFSNVGIGTTNPTEALFVVGNAVFTGNVSVAGTVTYDDVTNVDSVGVITARQDVIIQRNLFVSGITTLGASNGIGTVTIGIGNTALHVNGNARVTGILSIGQGTVTIDGNNNTITSGQVTITGSSITLGDNVTINAGASGINSAPNVLYVAKDGNNNNNGTSIDNAKLTIASAVSIAQSGTTIKVLSGSYNENNPIIVPPFVAIVGDSLKTVTVVPNNSTQDIFHLNKGTYLSQMTFTGHTAPSAAVAFPTGIATNVGGGSWESPYVQNCTSNTTTGTGMRIDGSLAEELKSMVVDSYTQYNQGGVGIAITNNGYAQLVSVFTICCSEAITVHKGGQCSLTNSNSDFGTFGLVANGVSDLQFVGTAASATAGTDNVTVAITTTTRPYEGQVVYFGELYQSVNTITVTNGGSGYTTAPTVTIAAPAGPSGITATAFASILNGSVTEITLITSGSQYTSTPSITISAPGSGTTATATATTAPIYYTINSSTPIVSGTTTLTLEENLNNTVSTGSTVYFFQVSKITASSHTFEYVGSGNTIATATPSRGGVAIPANEIIETAGGRVVFTSTDQSGNFKIGNDITINQNNGTITGRAFTRSLFNQMTPFILALS